MAKALQFPIDNLLQQFRIAALSTPPSAFEMSNLDKDMGDILSRTDLPKDIKVKLYNEALDKFRDVRSTYQKLPTAVPSNLPRNPESEVTAAKEEEEDEKNTPTTNTKSTLNPTVTLTPLQSGSHQAPSTTTPHKPSTKAMKQEYNDLKASLKSNLSSFIQTAENGGLVYEATPGGVKKRLGQLSEANTLVKYLLSDQDTDEPTFGTRNNRNNVLRSHIIQKVQDELQSNKKDNVLENDTWRLAFPNLAKYMTSDKSPSPRSEKAVKRRLRSRTSNQSGVGRIRVNFNKWNKSVVNYK